MKYLSRNIAMCMFLSLSFLTIASGQIQSNSSIGGLAGAPLRMGFGARGAAMGNALTAVINGDIQSYYNPAATPFESVPTLVACYGMLSLDRKLNYLSYTRSIKPDAGISLSMINAGVSNIDGRDEDGRHTKTYSTSENAFMLSFGLRPTPHLAIGVTAKILYNYLFEGIKSTTASVDFGMLYLLSQELTLGLVVQDINGKYKWDTSSLYDIQGISSTDHFPLRKRIGLSWMPLHQTLLLSGEFEAIGSATFVRVGSEIEVYDGISIRGGIDQIALDTDLPAKPAIGLSFQTALANWITCFQYAYVFEPYSPSGIHLLSLSLRFK